jgi:hypothetical protein
VLAELPGQPSGGPEPLVGFGSPQGFLGANPAHQFYGQVGQDDGELVMS